LNENEIEPVKIIEIMDVRINAEGKRVRLLKVKKKKKIMN
jgi:hypothetical protein